ncbi:GNAT family N-acetyltransferase [Virgibacillus sp. C22-A2]|uniref:GNAT family N-acetyltransferase n=1 Tax=Virgibacillus tibetensis TaxID=3042313 RepID=A0ABU6KK37_9BACI|nr:GNAT family N-acetyltransferase [Virgibacillus sp. C22-A2]
MLTNEQLHAIKKLQRECELEESIQIKLNWDMLRRRNDKEIHDFFYYADKELTGFLGFYRFGDKIELCGMVKPAYRRKGIFSELFREALTTLSKSNYKTILLNAPSNSLSAAGFINTQHCEFSMTEHQMKCSDIKRYPNENNDIIIRRAENHDLNIEVELDVSCFNFPKEEAKAYNKRIKNDETHEFYMIENKGQTLGKIRIARVDNELWIYGFAIFPEHQGKGIGRAALLKLVNQERVRNLPIFLEVETKNTNALRLYESCGFKSYQSQDYYIYKNPLT